MISTGTQRITDPARDVEVGIVILALRVQQWVFLVIIVKSLTISLKLVKSKREMKLIDLINRD